VTNTELRLECLRLAVQTPGVNKINTAREYMEYVLGDDEEPYDGTDIQDVMKGSIKPTETPFLKLGKGKK
jgi:hypothetical protein